MAGHVFEGAWDLWFVGLQHLHQEIPNAFLGSGRHFTMVLIYSAWPQVACCYYTAECIPLIWDIFVHPQSKLEHQKYSLGGGLGFGVGVCIKTILANIGTPPLRPRWSKQNGWLWNSRFFVGPHEHQWTHKTMLKSWLSVAPTIAPKPWMCLPVFDALLHLTAEVRINKRYCTPCFRGLIWLLIKRTLGLEFEKPVL